jgi:hypothetical protein
MSNKGIVKIEGISCDYCDYENRTLTPSEYEEWVDKPCPECGKVILTEDDYNVYKLLTATTNIANKIPTSIEDVQLPTNTGKVYQPSIGKNV